MGHLFLTPRRWIAHFSRRPAVPAAVFFIAGILLHNGLVHRPPIWLAVGAAAVAVAAGTIRRTAVSTLALCIAIVAFGIATAQVEHFYFPRDHIGLFVGDEPRLAWVEMNVNDPPRTLVSPGMGRPLPPKQTMTGDVAAVLTNSGWRPALGKLLVTLEQPHPRLYAGQRVRVLGMLERPLPPMNPGEFDWSAYERDQRVLAALRVPHADDVQILEDCGPSPLAWMREKTRRLVAAGFSPEQSIDHALLAALLLGDPDAQLHDLQDNFAATGTIHHLSISGLHVAILGGFVLLLCRLLRCSPRFSLIAMTLFVIVYAAVALPTQPGIRSVVLCIAAAIGLMFRRSMDVLQLLACSIFVVLVIHPTDVYNGGFQVSFAAVLGLMLLTRPVAEFVRGLRKHQDPWKIPKPGAFYAGARWLRQFLLQALFASAVAWAAAMPLVVLHFGQVNPWSAVANVLLLPVTVVALVGGLLKVLLTLLWPSAATLWASAAVLPIALLRHAVDGLAKLPGGSVPMAAPSFAWIVAYYTLLLLPLMPWRWERVGRVAPAFRWCTRCAPVTACAVMLLVRAPLQARAGPASTPPASDLQVTLLSVGAGQCAIVRLPSGSAIFVDAGSLSVPELGRRLVFPFLRQSGIRRIDSIFLSHGDYDHISAAADITEAWRVPKVYMSPHFRRHAVGNGPAEALLETLERLNRPPPIAARGDRIDLGSGAAIDVLWPPIDCTMNSNNCGLVLRLTYAGRSILFPADIQEPAEAELLKDPAKLKSDILVAPHHGSAEITTAAFVKAVDPQIIVASNASKMTHKQRVFDEIVAGKPFYRTSQFGALTISIGADGQLSLGTFVKSREMQFQSSGGAGKRIGR